MARQDSIQHIEQLLKRHGLGVKASERLVMESMTVEQLHTLEALLASVLAVSSGK